MDVEKLVETLDIDTLISYGTRIAGGVFFLLIGYIVAGWIGRVVRRALEARKLDLTLSAFAGSMVRYGVLVMVILSALSLFGIETTSFAAVVGAAGLAIGLALQGTLGNLASGVLLVAFRPFKIGDLVETCGYKGTVEEITLFTTILRTPDNRVIIVPNGPVFNGSIENITTRPQRRVDIAVGVDYSADIKKTREVLHGVYNDVEGVLHADKAPADPAVVLTGLGASSVDWALRVWVDTGDYWPVRERLLERTKNDLDAAGIGIPYPQMDVHLFKNEG